MKNYFIGFCAVLMTNAALAVCPAMDAPLNFKLKEKVISNGIDFKLKVDGATIGTITERKIRLTPTFVLQNSKGQKVAVAHEQMFQWGTNIEIKDCDGARIGVIKELVFRNMLRLSKKYEIYDAADRLVANSIKKEFLSTQFEIKGLQGQTAIIMSRGAINLFADTWEINTLDSSVIDPRIAIMIPAFKTSADIREEQEEKRQEREKDKERKEKKERKERRRDRNDD